MKLYEDYCLPMTCHYIPDLTIKYGDGYKHLEVAKIYKLLQKLSMNLKLTYVRILVKYL